MTWRFFPEVDQRMDDDFMQKVVAIRIEFDEAMNVTRSLALEAEEIAKGRSGKSGHVFGRAIDIAIFGAPALRLVGLAVKHGMTGVGIKQHGPHDKRFVHIDDMGGTAKQPRPYLWGYK